MANENVRTISKPQAEVIGDSLLAEPVDGQREVRAEIERRRSPAPSRGRIPAILRAVALFFGFRSP